MSKKVTSKVQAELDAIAQREEEIKAESLRVVSELSGEHYDMPQRPTTGKSLVSGGGYHDFKKYSAYQGRYLRNHLQEEDDPKNKKKKGDIIGYIFTDGKRETIITNSFLIEKALKAINFSTEKLLYIEFLGKTEHKGKPFSRFDVIEVA